MEIPPARMVSLLTERTAGSHGLLCCSADVSPGLHVFLCFSVGDLVGALEFPSLQSHTFHCGCCARYCAVLFLFRLVDNTILCLLYI